MFNIVYNSFVCSQSHLRRDHRTRGGFRFRAPLPLSDLFLILSKVRYRQYPRFVPAFENEIVEGFLRLIPGLRLHPEQANRAYDENVEKKYWRELPRLGYSGRQLRTFTITELGWIRYHNLGDWWLFSKGLKRVLGPF